MHAVVYMYIYIYIHLFTSSSFHDSLLLVRTRQGFRCVIKISDKNINASGVSRSFKNAKILAASQALKQLNNL